VDEFVERIRMEQRVQTQSIVESLAREDEREKCAQVAENGRFLHDDAPSARFGRECAAAIRARGQPIGPIEKPIAGPKGDT
jgi:hypothetical protein